MKTFKLHLIRHGLTQGNLDHVYVGGGMDLPLCGAGEDQLRSMAARYDYPAVGIVFASPMQRALQTAGILYPHVAERVVLEDLRECAFGEFEGLPVKDLVQNEDYLKWLDPQSGYTPKGGESGSAFARRTAKALMDMMHHMVREGVTQAACITHGGVIMSMLAQKALPQKPPAKWMAQNGCGYTVQTSTSMLMRDEMVEAVAVVPPGFLDE